MDLKLINDLSESTQYRSKQGIKQTDARTVCDFAFMDMIGIWILYNEFEFAPFAMDYAKRTVQFTRFNNFRQMSTDLYINLHVITEDRVDLLGSEADAILLNRIQLDEPRIIRYLRNASTNRLTQPYAQQTLLRLEQSLYIQDSNYRSIRRLAQSWPTLNSSQKRTVITRMNFFYRANARRSEMGHQIAALGKSGNFIDPNANNPETLKKAAAGAAAGAAGAVAGYHFGKSLV